jgi:hypothetical protein
MTVPLGNVTVLRKSKRFSIFHRARTTDWSMDACCSLAFALKHDLSDQVPPNRVMVPKILEVVLAWTVLLP